MSIKFTSRSERISITYGDITNFYVREISNFSEHPKISKKFFDINSFKLNLVEQGNFLLDLKARAILPLRCNEN